ncbi:MAG: hypothetical protein DMG05_30890 [Acidobacteria bacterium]|nr:MAG: hypothetical protein DMG05_30890 [Acidobacteriota bacterium]
MTHLPAFRYIVFLVFLSGCTTGSALVSKAYPPVPVDQIQVLFSPPSKPYEEIAIVNSHGRGYGSFDRNQRKALERLKEEAAAVGADAILLMGPTQQSTAVAATLSPISGAGGAGFGVAGPAGDAMLQAMAIKYK